MKNCVAVVTGASSGLGLAFAGGLAEAGAKERLDALAGEMTAQGFETLAVACEVTAADDVDRMVRAALERFGRIDILVNNAGLSVNLPAEEEPVEDFSRAMGINVTGTFICAQRYGRVMLEGGREASSVSSRCGALSGSAPSPRHPTPRPRGSWSI